LGYLSRGSFWQRRYDRQDFLVIAKQADRNTLAKLTSKNQITIPQRIIDQIPDAGYIKVELNDRMLVLRPLKIYSASLEEIRAMVENLDPDPGCVREAIKWRGINGLVVSAQTLVGALRQQYRLSDQLQGLAWALFAD
jgi:hypothetical protein